MNIDNLKSVLVTAGFLYGKYNSFYQKVFLQASEHPHFSH